LGRAGATVRGREAMLSQTWVGQSPGAVWVRTSGPLKFPFTGPGAVHRLGIVLNSDVIELKSDATATGPALLLAALRQRWRLRRASPALVLAPAAGGAASLLGARMCSRLVTVLEPVDRVPSRLDLRGWLERRQARRSALVVAPDRATAVAHATRMKLDLARIRVQGDAGSGAARNRLLRELSEVKLRVRPWHSVRP